MFEGHGRGVVHMPFQRGPRSYHACKLGTYPAWSCRHRASSCGESSLMRKNSKEAPGAGGKMHWHLGRLPSTERRWAPCGRLPLQPCVSDTAVHRQHVVAHADPWAIHNDGVARCDGHYHTWPVGTSDDDVLGAARCDGYHLEDTHTWPVGTPDPPEEAPAVPAPAPA
jgi:hypothetical protein